MLSEQNRTLYNEMVRTYCIRYNWRDITTECVHNNVPTFKSKVYIHHNKQPNQADEPLPLQSSLILDNDNERREHAPNLPEPKRVTVKESMEQIDLL